MKSLFSAAILLSLGLAASAQTAEDANAQKMIDYQKKLLARKVPPDMKKFCDGKVAASTGDQKITFDGCRVTRWFLIDIAANTDEAFPPLTDIRCADTVAEQNAVVDRLTKYGG